MRQESLKFKDDIKRIMEGFEKERMKIRSNTGGINRISAFLIAIIAVLLVLLLIPGWKIFRYRSEKTGCDQAMKSATDGLIIEYLFRRDTESVDEARKTLDEVLIGRDNICPTGGTVYLVEGENGIYVPVCGLHGSDAAQKTRLNASYAKDCLNEALAKERKRSEEEPESVVIQVNGKDLECLRVQKEEELFRGTGSTKDYEGVVCFYGIVGDGIFTKDYVVKGIKGLATSDSVEQKSVEEVEPTEEEKDKPENSKKSEESGEKKKSKKNKKPDICYFLYADEDYCAVWGDGDGWTGTAYDDY